MPIKAAYMPWLSICTVIGGGIGYLVGGQGTLQGSSVPILYGMLAGLFVGMVVSIVIRVRARRQRVAEAAAETAAPPEKAPEDPPEAGA
ncbi:MAG: hypothetical protein GYA21_00125 [Myxococcales bacterium]|nr:hypothetical protein [Myxococcales bacterium]